MEGKREREAERFFRFPLDENRESEKPIFGNERFFQEEEEEVSVGILFELYYGKEMF